MLAIKCVAVVIGILKSSRSNPLFSHVALEFQVHRKCINQSIYNNTISEYVPLQRTPSSSVQAMSSEQCLLLNRKSLKMTHRVACPGNEE